MFIGWIEGQDLPVRCAHFLQMIDKTTCGSAQRTRLALTGDGSDVAHHAPTVGKRLLQALARVKIDSSAAQGVQRYRGHAIDICAEGVPRNEVGRGLSHKRNAHRMCVAGIAIDEQAHVLVVSAVPRVHEDVGIESSSLNRSGSK